MEWIFTLAMGTQLLSFIVMGVILYEFHRVHNVRCSLFRMFGSACIRREILERRALIAVYMASTCMIASFLFVLL